MVIPLFLCTFAPDNEPLKRAGGSASSGLTIRISWKNAEIRRFPIRNLENRVISQTSDKQRWFEISSKVTKKRVKCKRKACFSFHFRVQSKFGEAKGKEKVLIIKLFKEKRVLLTKRALFRRGDRTRTCDSLVPNQERYQLRYTSI